MLYMVISEFDKKFIICERKSRLSILFTLLVDTFRRWNGRKKNDS